MNIAFEQYIVDRYDKSTDQIKLDIATQWAVQQSQLKWAVQQSKLQKSMAGLAWAIADDFIETMRQRWEAGK